jgi:endoglucanase
MTTRRAIAALTFLIAALGFAACQTPPTTTTTTTTAGHACSAPPGFTISICGNKWVNGSGQTVVLRGANTEGTQYDCAQSGAGFFDDPTVSGTNFTTEIAAMKAWGINVVRVNLNEECWLGINGVPATTSAVGSNGYNAYANEMGTYVSALNSAGIYAEVDLHLNAPGTELIADKGNNDDQNPLPEANSVTFWKSVATYFAANRAVIFGVFNEPFPVNYNSNGDTATGWACDVNGCTIPHDCTASTGNCKGASYAGVGMKALITTIRSVDTTTPLLVGGPDFAGDMDDWLSTFYPGGMSIDPSNLLAASVHIYYPAPDGSPCDTSTNVATTCAGAVAQVAAKTPVLIDELGDFGCSAKSLTPFLASIDAENASAGTDIGWVGWAWTTSSCDPNMITSWTTGKPSAMGTAEYCQLHTDGLNNGSLTTCKGA